MTQSKNLRSFLLLLLTAITLFASCGKKGQYLSMTEPRRVEILVLGHESEHHNSEKLMMYLSTPLFQKGINLTYTTDLNDLNEVTLNNYDGLMIYANHEEISPEQENALKTYIQSGKALIPIHSASFCFQNSDWYIEAVGGQFSSHGTGDFTVDIIDAEHPAMAGISEFETWDETYVHAKVNPDKQVLMERVEGDKREPYTWVRNEGKGRVFYTAYGHNEKTWEKKGFQELVANGILWAVGDKVNELLAAYEIPTPEFRDAEIPNYEKRDPAPRFQLPLTPEQSMKLIQIPVGFEMQLFASEPMIINPMAMAWDEQGRLFVIETTDYPNEVRKEGGNDKIKILEDTNGDGKADKVTVFADNLNIPTSIMAINGGILISMAPDFVFLKDTDGDNVADVREVVMTGWGKSDTHAGPSNLKYGFDNKIWGVLGYSGFNGEVSGVKHQFGQGVYRFDPSGDNLEYLGNTSNNTWGLGFTEDFETFISTANGQHSVYYALSNNLMKRPVFQGTANGIHGIDSHYDMPHLTPFLRQVDWFGGYTAAAGHNFYTARSFPKNYWNRISFVAEPTGRVLHNNIILPNGSGYTEKNGFNILASSDEWFAPVHAEVGPDGALWVADWYNFIIQHNPTPRGFENGEGNAYINPLRDSKHGRIYRIVYKGGKDSKTFDLKDASGSELLAALKSDNMFWRMTAQRLILEKKDTSLASDLYAIINDQKVDEIGLNGPAINAIWTLHGLGLLDGSNDEALQVVTNALKHPSDAVKKNALRVLPASPASTAAILQSGLLSSENLVVRKNALVAISAMPGNADLSKYLVTAAEDSLNAKDEFLPQALFAAVIAHPEDFSKRDNTKALEMSAEDEFSLSDRISRSLALEQYSLDSRNSIPFPPNVVGKQIFLEMMVSKTANPLDGILMAQGNNINGYSLYVFKDALHFAVAQDEKVTIIKSGKNLPEEQFTVNASITQDGSMTLSISGKQVAQGKTKGLFTTELMPNRIRVGQNDSQNVVGDYEGGWRFSGRISNKSSLVLKNPETAEVIAFSGDAMEVQSTIALSAVPHKMKFDKDSFRVKAGTQVTIDFENPDFMQHNLIVGTIGSLEIIGQAADQLAKSKQVADYNFVPEIPQVIAATGLVDPEESESLVFTTPETVGDYPFLCTIPGHWRTMNGVMKVE
jgi:putative membrane-bound dehydrogenase-like protein